MPKQPGFALDEQEQEVFLNLTELLEAHKRAKNLAVADILSKELVSLAENPTEHQHAAALLQRYKALPGASAGKKGSSRTLFPALIMAVAALIFCCLLQLRHMSRPVVPVETALAPASSPALYVPVDLGAVANYPMDWLISPPTGAVNLSGEQFVIRSGAKAVFQSSHMFLNNRPNDVTVPIAPDLPAPRFVKMIVSGGYVDAHLRGKQVGEIVLNFSDGRQQTTPLIALKNIREGWYYADQIPPIESKNIYMEPQGRDGKAAYGLLDELSIPVPRSEWTNKISSITIRDTSLQTVGSQNPSISVSGISFGW